MESKTAATSLPLLHAPNPFSKLSGFGAMSKWAVKLKRKATQARKKVKEKQTRTSLIPSSKVYKTVYPVKYTDRPDRLYRRVPYNHQDIPSQSELDLARYEGRPQVTAFPEFDGKIQLPPVTLSHSSFYKTPEERSLPVPFAEPAENRLCTEGRLYCCQDMPNHLFCPVFGFVDIMVPVLFIFENSDKVSYLHVRDIRGHSSKIIGWRHAETAKNEHMKCFCFEIHSLLDIGTGNEPLIFGTPDRNSAYKWLNYIRRSSQHFENETAGIAAKQPMNPLPPPPTRRYGNRWPSFLEVATTNVLVRDDDDDDAEHSGKKRTVQQILLDMGLIMDEKWVGGPATVFTIEARAAQQIQTWYRFKTAHYLVNGPHGMLRLLWAARVVQKALRGWRVRRRLKRTKESAVVIQRHWRTHRLARKVMLAKQDMARKIKRAKAYFLDSTRMRVIRVWKELKDTSLRAKSICKRVLLGNIEYSFDKWGRFVEFRLMVKFEKQKQEQKEKERRAMFFIKKMVYRHAATAIQSWKALVERNKRVRGLLKRHLTGLVEHHFTAWFEYLLKLQKSRLICKRVLFGVQQDRFDAWLHYIHGRLAARHIQTCWRRFTAYRNYILLARWQQYTKNCAYCIQSCWRIHVAWQTTWGAGGVFVKMKASTLIQTVWRRYVHRRNYLIYLRKVNLLQERFCYWLHRRRSAAVFVQYQWRRYWHWKVCAIAACTIIQKHIRRYFVRVDLFYQQQEISSSFQWDGIVLRGAVKISDRYGAMHRVLCTAKHVSGTLRFVFVDPRTCLRAELYFRTIQLIQLTEERWSVRRHMHDVVSLAQVVLDLIIVLSPGSKDTEYILRPKMLSAYAQTNKIAYPLRSPTNIAKNDILPMQVQFWDSVYNASALNMESRLPIGLSAQQLVLDTGKANNLRDTMLSINAYCGEENADERLRIAGSVIVNDLDSVLDGKKADDDAHSTSDDSDDDDVPRVPPTLVLKHSYTLAKLLVGLRRTPLDIFDRVEHRIAEILLEHDKKATKAFGEFAENRGMRPPTRENIGSASSSSVASSFRTMSGWNATPVAIQWEILIENSMSEMHSMLDTTQQMETPFVTLRETFEEAVAEQEFRHGASCYLIQQGKDELTEYLAHAGAVSGTTDMMIRARIAAFIDLCEDKMQVLNTSQAIESLHETIMLFQSLEHMRSNLLTAAFEKEDQMYPFIEQLDTERRNLIGSFFSKQRDAIDWNETALLTTANHINLILIPEFSDIVNRCMCAAEDFKSILFEIGPALEEIKECAHMQREDIESWYAQHSIAIIRDRDALNQEIAAKEQAKRDRDLAEAARGGKTVEQVRQERKESEAATRIARVYRAYLERNDNVNTGGVWNELLYNSKILISCLDLLVQVMEDHNEESYDLAMIQSLQMRVHKLSEQTTLRNLGPCLKHAHVVEKRWPIVLGLMERWEEEDRLAALKDDEWQGGASSSGEESESDWESEDFDSDDEDEEDNDDTDSDDDEDSGNDKENAQQAVARAQLLPQDIHAKLRVLWRAHLSTIQKERERQAAIRAAQFGPRMRRKFVHGAKAFGRTVVNSAPVRFTGRQLKQVKHSIQTQLRTMDGYQRFKLAFALFGYNQFPQYFAIPEGVKEKKATLIQKRVRGMLARLLATKMVEDRDERAFGDMMDAAAVKIQTLFRYFAARKYTLELVRVSYDKIYDDKAGKWCYHNTVADSYTYKKPPILGDRLDLPTPRSKARGMKWSAGYYVEKSKRNEVVERKLVLTHAILHACNHPACNLMEEKPKSFVQCQRCKVKYYCGRPHQLNHLDQHGDECERVCNQNREQRAIQRAANKMGIDVTDLNLVRDDRTEVQRKKDKQEELFKLEKLIDALKKGWIDQEEYTNQLRKLKDL